MHHRQRALRQVLRVKNHHIIPQHVEMIQQCDQVPLALAAAVFGDERRLLEGPRRSRPIHILFPLCQRLVKIPGVVTQAIKQPSRRGPALGKIVGPRRVDFGEPKVFVLLGDPAIVDTAEFAIGRPHERGRDACVGFVCVGVEDPARRGAGEAIGAGLEVGGFWVGGPPEEDVAVGDGEVDDNVALFVFVAAGDMAVESCGGLSLLAQLATEQENEG